MVQKVLPLKRYKNEVATAPEIVRVVGLRCEDSMVTFRFMDNDAAKWGQSARQIKMDRKLAEELSRLLADELEDYS